MDTQSGKIEEGKSPCASAPPSATGKKTFRRFKFAKPSLSRATEEKEKDPESDNDGPSSNVQGNALEPSMEKEKAPSTSEEKIKIISDVNISQIICKRETDVSTSTSATTSATVLISKNAKPSSTTSFRKLRFIKPKPSLNAGKEFERDDSSSEADSIAYASEIEPIKEEKAESNTTQKIAKKAPEISNANCNRIHVEASRFQGNEELELKLELPILTQAPVLVTSGECTLDETKITTHNVTTGNASDHIVIMPESPVKRVVPTMFDCSSPSKIKRAMVKAVPHLDQRRPSCSASESEDESRKTSRQRTDSVCSMMSNTSATSPTKSVVKADQSRKLADAKREFNMKFANASPAKNKLTMIDLIFYNPPTNPMVRVEKKSTGAAAADKQLQAASSLETPVDDADDPERSDEENEDLPAPQVIIGPDGNLIIDDKSLVVENKKLRKQREKLHRSAVIDGDNRETYGVYKRAKRSKEWDDVETIRFYNALNSIGTDFSTMCELFPQRTRRELKIKFKKEERVNAYLVDRALMQPSRFNFELLLQESILEEKEREVREECERVALEKRKKLNEEKRKARELKRLMREEEKKKQASQSENSGELSEREPWWKRRRGVKRKRSTKRVLDISSVLEESDSGSEFVDGDDGSSDDDFSQYEGVLIERPTRSGRIPKKRQLFESFQEKYERKKVDEESEKEEPFQAISAGDLVIVPSGDVEGEKGYDLVMVTGEDNKNTVTVKNESNSEIGSLVINSQGVLKITATAVTELMEEHNYTIIEGESGSASAGADTVGGSEEERKTC